MEGPRSILSKAGSASLPERFNPAQGSILGPLVGLFVSTLGAIVAALGIGLTSIPAGLATALRDVLGGLANFLEGFVAAFFVPTREAIGLGSANQLPGTRDAVQFIDGLGPVGFLLAIGVLGAALYVTGRGVSRLVG